MRCESDCGHHEGVAENIVRAEYAVRGGAVAKLCVQYERLLKKHPIDIASLELRRGFRRI